MRELIEERKRLSERLAWLGVRSTGSERIERRIQEIDELLARRVQKVREIAFRAWDKYEKKIVFWNDLLKKNLSNVFLGESYSGLKLMQYIGERDKNNNPVFDGDIVKCGNGFIGPIIYDRHRYEVEGYWNQSNDDPSNAFEEEVEVIGNIYENADLLNQK